ncbi:MAG: hypothetical protein QM500_20895 [Methylococcales bacterium]
MTKKKYVKYFIILVIVSVVSIFGYDKYLRLYKEYIIVYPVEDGKVYIEYKPRLIEIRKLVHKDGMKLEAAIVYRANELTKNHPNKPNNCLIKKVYGSIENGLRAQIICILK